MIVIGMKVQDRSMLRGLGRSMPAIRKGTMHDLGVFWHANILKRHFNSGARAAYGYRPRNPQYEARKRRRGSGQGKYLDLWFSGQSRRWMLEGVQITQTQGRVTLRMRVPWYFKNPNGLIRNERQRRKGLPIPKHSSRSQPEKQDEVTRFNARDRQDLRAYAAGRMQVRIAAARQPGTTTTIP